MRRGQTVYYGEQTAYIIRGITYHICVLPPPSLSIIWFCLTIFQMTFEKCILMVMPINNMNCMSYILMKMLDKFIFGL